MEHTPGTLEVEPLRVRVFAAASFVIGVLLGANLAAIVRGFATCSEVESMLAGLGLMAFYFYGLGGAAAGVVLGVIAWVKCSVRGSVWLYLAVSGAALSAAVVVAALKLFASGDFFGVDLHCR